MITAKSDMRDMYLLMLQIRNVEEKIAFLVRNDLVRGFTHQYIGEEAIATGICHHLRKQDYLSTTHRGHGHSLAKCRDLKGLLAEMLAKEAGYCKGKGGSMHLAETKSGNLGANGIVGGGLPVAVGAALAIKYQGLDNVVVAFFGDGASNQGLFHESINFAAVNDLPVLFACENNLYGEYFPVEKAMRVKHIADRAAAYGIRGITVDGNDLNAVYDTAQAEIEKLRRGEGPVLVEFLTYRHRGHSVNDPAPYKKPGEQEAWLEKCPIKRFGAYMLENGFTEQELAQIRQESQDSVEEALKFALAAPFPAVSDAMAGVYAE